MRKLLVVFLTFVLTACNPTVEDFEKANDEYVEDVTNPTEQEVSKEPTNYSDELATNTVGDSFTRLLQVTSVEHIDSLTTYTPTGTNKLTIVEVILKNTSDEYLTYNVPEFTLLTKEGDRYDPLHIWLNQGMRNGVIAPDGIAKGHLAFETPPNVDVTLQYDGLTISLTNYSQPTHELESTFVQWNLDSSIGSVVAMEQLDFQVVDAEPLTELLFHATSDDFEFVKADVILKNDSEHELAYTKYHFMLMGDEGTFYYPSQIQLANVLEAGNIPSHGHVRGDLYFELPEGSTTYTLAYVGDGSGEWEYVAIQKALNEYRFITDLTTEYYMGDIVASRNIEVEVTDVRIERLYEVDISIRNTSNNVITSGLLNEIGVVFNINESPSEANIPLEYELKTMLMPGGVTKGTLYYEKSLRDEHLFLRVHDEYINLNEYRVAYPMFSNFSASPIDPSFQILGDISINTTSITHLTESGNPSIYIDTTIYATTSMMNGQNVLPYFRVLFTDMEGVLRNSDALNGYNTYDYPVVTQLGPDSQRLEYHKALTATYVLYADQASNPHYMVILYGNESNPQYQVFSLES